ncbi:TetR/AcrR family transcriptional regulator [Pyxidicoccus caerfyrddinensis]|jgi:AcrR family transcriptional regulator|uniref:TetR/AcrR family transcriptional regulator n=1 Tax=Pyxidicoccus caerfyrddinensis TaxID=2709663 RepID=UPI0013DAFC75|nr:TetR/AcrR family transcriptional regulator [Pyxidicoccus caerfyrddinensis]
MTSSTPLPPRRKPRQSRAQATCDAIITATAQILVRDGYDAASTNHVARVAGVSVGSVYQYFSSKEALVMAVMDRYRAEGLTDLEEGFARVSGATLREALQLLIRQLLATKAANPRLHQVLAEQLPRMRQLQQVDPYAVRMLRMVRTFLEPHARTLRPRSLDMAAFIIFNTVESLTHAALADRPEYLAREDFADELCALVIGYLQPEREEVKRGGRPPVRAPRPAPVAARKARSSRKR